jgi:hypothetical protein
MQHLKLINKFKVSTKQVHRMTNDQTILSSYSHNASQVSVPKETLTSLI